MNQNLKRILKTGAIISAVVLSLFGCQNSNKVSEINGAGATFPYPLYSKMFSEYHKEHNVRVNYQSIGSGGGIQQLTNKTVDFGASDAFLSDKKLAASSEKIIHIPICLGAVSISYNLPGINNLKLTPDVLAKIFLGSIKNWNDPAIKNVNPSSKLPNSAIVVVHRSEGSGTTKIFTDYLSKISRAWKTKVGVGKSVNWPVGLGAKGNEGVAGIIQQTQGAIGFVSHIYAAQNNLSVVALKNKSGNYVLPSLESISEAANGDIPEDTRVSLTDTTAKKGYPIAGLTWILLYQDQNFKSRTKEQGLATKKLVKWMVTDGQKYAKPLLFAPLTDSMAQKAQQIIESITFDNTPL